jgi:hypothetical protein
MPDDDTRLATLLSAGLPLPRDPLFRIAVLARLERTRLRRRMAAMIVVGAATVLVGVNVAAISAWLAGDITRLAALAGVVAFVVWMFPGVSQLVPSTLRNLAGAFSRLTQTLSRSLTGSY